MQTLLEAGPTRMAESVRMVSPGLISLLDTRHRPDLLWDPTEKGNCDGILVSPMREEELKDTTVMVSLAIVLGASIIFILLLIAVVTLAFYRLVENILETLSVGSLHIFHAFPHHSSLGGFLSILRLSCCWNLLHLWQSCFFLLIILLIAVLSN